MSIEQNKAVVRRFYDEMLSRHDLSVAVELFTEDFIDHDPEDPDGRLSGVEGAKEEVAAYINAFPDMQVSVDDLFAEGDRVVVRGTLRATHNGEFAGIPPTGKSVNIVAIQTFRLVDGKIAEAWLSIDRLGMLQQLGVMPGASPAVA
jgi:steroid delta-isomerase-like uncharacterized protein